MRIKNFFNKVCLAFAFVGTLFGALCLSSNTQLSNTEGAYTTYNQIENNLPEYLEFNNSKSSITEDYSIVLMSGDGQLSLNIASLSTVTNENGNNYVYFPDQQNTNYYYYFDFTSSLSLYKDITNKDLSQVSSSQNLLQGSSIGDFASSHDDSFIIEGYEFAPKKLSVNFKLGSTFSTETNNITLTEGLYTLVIPMNVYYTYDNGLTFSSTTTQIEYTFMVFNSSTYFNSSTGLQNVTMENTEQVSLSNNIAYSMYYYYNYTTTSLPKFTYDPYVYQISINYTDYNQITHYAKIEFDGTSFQTFDENGQTFDADFVMTKFDTETNKAILTFNELGRYDLSFEYLYMVKNEENSQIFLLPFESLSQGENTQIKNLNQRLYVYGYQTVYTNYNEPVDSQTNQYTTKELKIIADNQEEFLQEQTADITSKISVTNHSVSPFTQDDLKTIIQNTIQGLNPATTNQVPIKFLSNVGLYTESFIYEVSETNGTKTLSDAKKFTNENQNLAGEYVYVIQYQFDDYMGEGGLQQSAYYHYQVFYFKITNEVPSISVLDENGENTIALTRYTNKSVYIVNESTKSPHNANVTIEVTLYDYSTGSTLKFNSLKELANYDSSTYTYYESFDSDISALNGKELVFINSTNKNANKKYTIEYKSTMNNPNSYSFTIDTNDIEFLNPKMVSEISNGIYRVGESITTSSTNSPFVFQWQEKSSGAITYGYVKQFSFEEINYYETDSLQTLLLRIVNSGVVPVSYKIDFSNSSSWAPVTNVTGNTAQGTNVKSSNGLYLLEVYDQAGNYGFYMMMYDNTQPLFIKAVTGEDSSTDYSIIRSSDIVPVVENAKVNINWGDYKAIILQNYSSPNVSSYEYAYMVDKIEADSTLSNIIQNYTSLDNSNVKSLSFLSSNIEEGLSYTSNYFIVEIDDTALVKSKEEIITLSGNSYSIDISNGDSAEGTYQIYIRDKSNSHLNDNILDYPSSKISITVTSDSSQTLISYTDENGENNYLPFANYSLSGNFYQNTENELSKQESEEFNLESTFKYKYMYFTPSTANRVLTLSYIPLTADSEIDTLTLSYYPYKIQNEGNYYYYDIDMQNPSNIVTIYNSSTDGTNLSEGEVKYFTIALGSDELPLNGRYVITRTYKEDSSASQYDFHQRILTIDIDSSNLISQLENTSNGAWESVIGGEIVLSMYSAENQSDIQVSFPFSTENTQNNDSFYNGEWTNEMESKVVEIPSVSGNKLPMILYIPKYKYTKFASYNKDDNSFSVTENNNLSYYGNAKIEPVSENGPYNIIVEGLVVETKSTLEEAQQYLNQNLAIKQYQIYATIEFTPVGANSPTVFYKTNGQTTGNYLNFYSVNSLKDNVPNGTTAVSAFYRTGLYTVTLYQASAQTSADGKQSDFYRFYKFSFEIESQQPTVGVFDQTTGLKLESKSDDTNNYYTNSPSLSIEWEIPTSEYMAKIDENAIEISYYEDANSNTSKNISFDIISFGTDSLERKILINLTEEQISKVGSKLYIRMQYEGYNSDYYNLLELNIFFDILAPTNNIQYLNSNVANSISSYLTNDYLNANTRENYKYDSSKTTSNEYAYSYTATTGNFKGYAYTVSQSFIQKLFETYRNASTKTLETQNIYYKFIGNSDNYISLYTSPTTKETFVDSAFNEIDENSMLEDFENGSVYEIVEVDNAGNMTVYLINYVNNLSETGSDNVAVTFSNKNEEIYTIYNNQISNNSNIYSNTGFLIKSLNYQNNPWGIYKVALNNGDYTYYMASPNLSDGFVYSISKPSSSEVVLTSSTLSQMFSQTLQSSSLKHSITFNDTINGIPVNTFVTIMDANLETQTIKTAEKNSAVLDIYIPSASQVTSLTNGYIYPTNIIIERYENGKWQPLTEATQNENTYGTWDFGASYNELVNFTTSTSTLRITVSVSENTKIKYTITDNFGNKTQIIQIANEVDFIEVTGNDYVYEIAESGNAVTYLANKSLTYSYNEQLYTAVISKLQNNVFVPATAEDYTGPTSTQKIRSLQFKNSGLNYDLVYKIELFDLDDQTEPLKTIYVKIYNSLPEYNSTSQTNNIKLQDKNGNTLLNPTTLTNQTVNFNGYSFVTDAQVFTTYSQNATLSFTNGQSNNTSENFYNSKLPYSVYISFDNGTSWQNINEQYEGYLISGTGNYQILVKYDSENYFKPLCKLFYLTIVDSSSVYYYITVDGENVGKADVYYTNDNNKTFESTYIVSVDYNDKNSRFNIAWNEDEELGMSHSLVDYYPTGDGVYVEEYSYYSKTSSGSFAVIYIPTSQNFVTSINYENASTGYSTPVTGNSITVYASLSDTNFDKLKINFKSYYGIETNKIKPIVLKYFNGSYVKVDCTVYKNNETSSYIYLEKAGSYRITFTDSCSPENVQKFGNNEYLSVIFLNEVPFVISYKDGEEIITSEKVQKAVYNSPVTISLYNLSNYFQVSGYPKISVKKDGVDYNITSTNNVYTFSESGYYSVKFSATTLSTVEIREVEYNFSIINSNESKYAYSFSQYKDYYIKQVLKNGIDITQSLINISNFDTVSIDGKLYLSEIALSFGDEKTGSGRYTITICSNQNQYSNILREDFTFDVWINSSTPPINVSINEGETTSNPITVTINVQSFYESIGDSYIIVGRNRYDINSDTISSYNEIQNFTIEEEGTWYIQVYSASGDLLYSYKVYKTSPLNAFSIIAIVISVIVLIIIIIITIKLRKRQKAK